MDKKLEDAVEYAKDAIARTPVNDGPVMVPREKLKELYTAACAVLLVRSMKE
jgi:hypothetical protein